MHLNQKSKQQTNQIPLPEMKKKIKSQKKNPQKNKKEKNRKTNKTKQNKQTQHNLQEKKIKFFYI